MLPYLRISFFCVKMNIMKIAIIEDEQIHTELLEGYLQEWGKENQIKLSIVSFPSAESFLFQWEEERDYEAIFVDIQMKKMNGMEMARRIRQEDSGIAIIFTTGITDYLADGYEVEALHYLIKPLKSDKVWQCMDKIASRHKPKQYLLLHGLDGMIKIAVNCINYVEAQGHRCRMEVADTGKPTPNSRSLLPENNSGNCAKTAAVNFLEVTESISEIEALLPAAEFIKCHRSYLCRIAAIHRIDRTEICFDSGSRIPVSRRLYQEVNQRFIQYFRRG